MCTMEGTNSSTHLTRHYTAAEITLRRIEFVLAELNSAAKSNSTLYILRICIK